MCMKDVKILKIYTHSNQNVLLNLLVYCDSVLLLLYGKNCHSTIVIINEV